jgi:hypothetical protein
MNFEILKKLDEFLECVGEMPIEKFRDLVNNFEVDFEEQIESYVRLERMVIEGEYNV